ncbi:hypothetical protein G7Y79_00006g020060 [Physcia stellaris]|nr:hypothetical protein G7Y79_00006g020060 [Physcia stellaris]
MDNMIDLTEDDAVERPLGPSDPFGSDGLDNEALIHLADSAQNRKDTTSIAKVLSPKTAKPRAWRLPDLEDDHMQAVVDFLVPQPKAQTARPSHRVENGKTPRKPHQPTIPSARKDSNNGTSLTPKASVAFIPPRAIYIPDIAGTADSATPATTTPVTPRLKRSRQPFNFLQLPPELRNRVYGLLLTTFDPIELTRARQTTAKRTDDFAKCKTAKARRSFKTIFLEILQTSKQVHQEATTILYGNNVFKFRSDHKAGYRDPRNMLPEKYLGLLKRVKVSVISREAENGQDQWVADLLNSTFSREKTRLDMFELTWYGWKKFRLSKEGVVCQALLNLDVAKIFSVKVAGDARMRTAMLQELTHRVKTRKVEIRRPVIEVLKAGKMVEVSDDE